MQTKPQDAITQIRAARRKAEDAIEAILKEFTDSTGLTAALDARSVQSITIGGEVVSVGYQVKLEARL